MCRTARDVSRLPSTCRVHLKVHGSVASDAYNHCSVSGAPDGLPGKQHVPPQQQGFGLGLDEFDDLPSSQESSATAAGSPPQPLMPYGGIDRKPLPPSPVRMAPLRQAPTAQVCAMFKDITMAFACSE